MAAASSTLDDYRPLLRATDSTQLPAVELIEAHGFGGVIVQAQNIASLAPEFSSQGLKIWLDLTHFATATLRGWHLEMRGEALVVAHNLSDEIDWYSSDCASYVIDQLEHLELSDNVHGIMCWEAHPEYSSLHPSFPWSPFLPAKFTDSTLQALVASTGNEAARWRQEYWDALHELRESEFKKLRTWCEAKQVRCGLPKLRPEWRAIALNPQLRASVKCDEAKLSANEISITPLNGNTYTELLKDCYSKLLAGCTHFEFATSAVFFDQGLKVFNDAVARAAQLVGSTRNNAHVGVLFPSRSAQTHYHPDGHRLTRWVGEDLQFATQLLHTLHFDWVFVFEDELFPEEYSLDMIVVPGVTAMGAHTWKKLEDFVSKGGKVACLGLLPRWSEEGRDAEFQKYVGRAALVEVSELYDAYEATDTGGDLPPTIGFPVFREHPDGGRFCSYQPRLNDDPDDASLRVHQILHESLQPDFESQNKSVQYTHRLADNGDSLFLLWNNSDKSERINARIVPNHDAKRVMYTDFVTGVEEPLPVWMAHPAEQGGGLSVTVELGAGETCVLTTSNTQSAPHLERANIEVESFDGTVARGYATSSTAPRIALRRDNKLEWFAGTDAVAPFPLLLSSDDWTAIRSTNGNVEYSQVFQAPASWHNCRVFLEIAQTHSTIAARLNGDDCGTRITPPWRFDLSRSVKCGGENSLLLTVSPCANEDMEIIARLVAYPEVIISVEDAHE
jgi:hypothetical protein